MSELKTNKLTGTSTAGSISVVAEGNSTTTNLQQGLAKAWIDFEADGTVETRDSFNHSSVTDNGTGDYSQNFTNSFSSANRSDIIACNYGRNTAIAYVGAFKNTPTTSKTEMWTFYTLNASKTDILGDVMITSCGDLA